MISEKKLIEEIEKDEWKPVKELKKEKEKLKKAVENKYKKKRISVSLYEEYIKKLKKKSLETGIPYQTIIYSLVHQYLSGKIKVEI